MTDNNQRPIDIGNVLEENNAGAFIQNYFNAGEKSLPLLIKQAEAKRFINRYFATG